MKAVFAFLLLSTLLALALGAPSLDAQSCQTPAIIDLVKPESKLKNALLLDKELCGKNICVNAAAAYLVSSPSKICQGKNKEQGSFRCTRTAGVGGSGAVENYGYDYCAIPANSETVASFQCPDGGATIKLTTSTDGKASYAVSRRAKGQAGSAYFQSFSSAGNSACPPWSDSGNTNVINDVLIITCNSVKVDCFGT